MALTDVVGQSTRDAQIPAVSTGRLLNCYREPVQDGDKTKYALLAVPGMTNRYTLNGVFMRAMETVRGAIYAVCGGNFYEVTDTAVTLLGAVADSPNTTISGHDGYVTVAAGGNYYVWDGSTLTTPAAGAITSIGSVSQEGSYTLLTELDGKRWEWSSLADATNLPGTNFASAEQRDDNLLRVFPVTGLVWLFGTASIEIWTRTGLPGAAAFEFLTGGVYDIGLKAFGLVTRFDGGVFFVGEDGIVYISSGTGMQPVSTPAVASAIEAGAASRCISYEARGHKFCGIIFDDRPAWFYDISTGEWHERSEGVDHAPWAVVASAQIGQAWYVGRNNGVIASLERTASDGNNPLVREFVSRTLYRDGQRFKIAAFEMYARHGLDVPPSGALAATVEFSPDNGLTWGKQRSVNLGGLGQYGLRAILRALGQFRQATVKIRMSDPVYAPVYASANLVIA